MSRGKGEEEEERLNKISCSWRRQPWQRGEYVH
jgi:hypothetical protein